MSDDPRDETPSDLRFETVPYRPDGGVSLLGYVAYFVITIVLGGVTGLACGLFYGDILNALWWIPEGHLLILAIAVAYLVLNLPLLLAIGVGVGWAKIRNPLAALLPVIPAWIMVAVVGLWMGYYEWIVPNPQIPTDDVVASVIGFLMVVAGCGFGSAAMAHSRASQPFCAPCGSWKKVRLQRRLGVPAHILYRAVQTGDVMPLAELDLTREGPMRLTVTACPSCGLEVPAEVKLEHQTIDGRGRARTEVLAHVTYPGSAAVVLEAIFDPEDK